MYTCFTVGDLIRRHPSFNLGGYWDCSDTYKVISVDILGRATLEPVGRISFEKEQPYSSDGPFDTPAHFIRKKKHWLYND